MAVFTATLEGLDEVLRVFDDINKELSASQTRGILDEAGRVVVSQAKTEIPWNGQIGEFFKRDLGVYRDHATSAKNAEYVLIGPRFKNYSIHGTDQKVATIAQHMTQGFSQTERETKSKGKRGKVAVQTLNPVLDAFKSTASEQRAAIDKGIKKQLAKLAAKWPYLLKYI